MCFHNSIHPSAQNELVQIRQAGNVTQRCATQVAWYDAHAACLNRSPATLFLGIPHPKGQLYFSQKVMPSLLGSTVRAKVVVAQYLEKHGDRHCLDILACDTTGSAWIIGPLDPEVRGAKRIP